MKRLIVIILFLVSTTKTWSCTCFGETTVKEELKRSDLVIVGTVIDSNIARIWSDTTGEKNLYNYFVKTGYIDSNTNYEYWKNDGHASFKMIDFTIVVNKKYKGARRTDTIIVRTGFGHGDCGFNFELGKQYLIYAEKEYKVKYNNKIIGRSKRELRNIYRTNICWRTKPLLRATEEIRIIKK